MTKDLRILFISRATLYTVKGGDTIQILKTAQALSAYNILVDIRLCTDRSIDYSGYDLLHFFNIIRPADILIHIEKSKKPYVVSTIFVEYSAYEAYSAKHNWKRKLLNLFNTDTREYLKAIGRMVFNQEKINSVKYLRWGHRRSIQYILRNASLLLPNSESEYQRLLKAYKIDNSYVVVNNAADVVRFNYDKQDLKNKEPHMIVCVARIEGRKNQLNLIKALNNSVFELYIIGNPAPNHIEYFNECKRMAASNIHFVEEISQGDLVSYYKKAKVHVLPSWFETTGLSSLEALFCGCNIVITEYGDTKDYFGFTNAVYCDPSSTESIRQAVEKATLLETETSLIDKARELYSWERTAKSTSSAYKTVLNLP